MRTEISDASQEAWTEVEDYLERIADLQGLQLHRVAALPEWRERLAVRIAAHDLALAAHRLLGDQAEQIERTRLAVVGVLDGAAAAGAGQGERAGHFVGRAAGGFGETHRLQEQHECPGNRGERLSEWHVLMVFERTQGPGDVDCLPVHRADEPGSFGA